MNIRLLQYLFKVWLTVAVLAPPLVLIWFVFTEAKHESESAMIFLWIFIAVSFGMIVSLLLIGVTYLLVKFTILMQWGNRIKFVLAVSNSFLILISFFCIYGLSDVKELFWHEIVIYIIIGIITPWFYKIRFLGEVADLKPLQPKSSTSSD